MSLEALLAAGGVQATVEDDGEWRVITGTYRDAPFTYRVSSGDDDDAARNVLALLASEFESGAIKAVTNGA